MKASQFFDPTPEEAANAERAKPLRVPKCFKCKIGRRIAISDTFRNRLPETFLHLSDALTGQQAENYSRGQVATLKLAHAALARASKGRYCTECVNSTIFYVDDVLSKLASP